MTTVWRLLRALFVFEIALLLHEAGHAFAALAVGVDFTLSLLPVGVFVDLKDYGPRSIEETSTWHACLIELSGLFASATMAALLYWKERFPLRGWFMGPVGFGFRASSLATRKEWLHLFFSLNVSLVFFNLLPLFPLDMGGVVDHVLYSMYDDRGGHISANLMLILYALMSYTVLAGLFVVLSIYDVFCIVQRRKR